MCEVLDVSRGTFYNHIFRRKDVTVYDKRREEIREQVRIVFEESKQRFGAKKVRAVLVDHGIRTSVQYVTELMREMGLQCVGRNAKRDYKKQLNRTKKQDLLRRQFHAAAPNIVWISDITCFKLKGKYYYVCVIIDLFSRRVIANRTSSKNSTYLVTSSFRCAFDERNRPEQLPFHSDQGVQYTSRTFRVLLRMNNIVQSFSKTGSPHDNAVAEAFFANMKKEELYRVNYKSEREFRESVDEYMGFYNSDRPHSALAYRTPEQFEARYEDNKRSAG
jgi:transposase InsO family protein